MKTYLTVAVLLSAVIPAMSQNAVPEPEFNDVFTALVEGKLIPLERETATIHAGGGGFMVVGTKAAYEIPGNKSPVRFHTSQPLVFVVRTALASTSVDPSTFYVLRRLDSKKKTREAVFMTGHFSPVGGSTKTDLMNGTLPVSFTHYGASSLKLSVDQLPPGEYALSFSTGPTVFCFGID